MEGVKEVISAIGGLREDLGKRHSENATAQAATDAKVVELLRGIDDLRRAFPDGDWDAHRRYHESIIERTQARTAFYRELSAHLIKGGAWALIVFLAWASWQAIKAKVKA